MAYARLCLHMWASSPCAACCCVADLLSSSCLRPWTLAITMPVLSSGVAPSIILALGCRSCCARRHSCILAPAWIERSFSRKPSGSDSESSGARLRVCRCWRLVGDPNSPSLRNASLLQRRGGGRLGWVPSQFEGSVVALVNAFSELTSFAPKRCLELFA